MFLYSCGEYYTMQATKANILYAKLALPLCCMRTSRHCYQELELFDFWT